MSDLRDLYQDVILDHSKQPRNFGGSTAPTAGATGTTRSAATRLTVYAPARRRRRRGLRLRGTGCAISTASASMMTEALKGRTRAEAERLFERFHDMVTGRPARRRDDATWASSRPSPACASSRCA